MSDITPLQPNCIASDGSALWAHTLIRGLGRVNDTILLTQSSANPTSPKDLTWKVVSSVSQPGLYILQGLAQIRSLVCSVDSKGSWTNVDVTDNYKWSFTADSVMFTVPNGDGSVLMHVYGTSIISNSITFAIFDKTRHIFVEQNATWSTPIGSGTPNAFAVTSMNFGNSTVALKIIPLNPTATPSTSSSIKVISAPASMGTSCSLFSGTVRGAILGNDYYIFCSNSGRSLNYLATSDGITFNAPVKVNTSIGYPESFFPFASTPGSGVTWAFMNNDTSIAGLTLSGPNIGAWQDMNYSINVTGWSNPNGGSSGSSDGSFGGSSNSIFKGGVPVSAIIGIVIACLTVLCVVSTWTCRYMARRKRLQSVEVVHASCMPLQQTSTTFVPPTFENYEHGQQYQMYPPPPSVQAHQSHDQPEMSPAPAYTPYPTKNDEMGASLSSPYIPATTASVSSTPTFAQPQHLQQYPGTAVGRPQTDVQYVAPPLSTATAAYPSRPGPQLYPASAAPQDYGDQHLFSQSVPQANLRQNPQEGVPQPGSQYHY
ncbi:hypothetical protein BC939DRAFT_508794 [Gamsiella multidivaricata]|uniref:uncharacterized protein n=1 Tax=Gamsiella multidivaricata TaxID=101098 RepID=UPI002220E1B6|nr:uncharacterized protein BC939DRAFT_508794 [Gamsiella multidivaricata]KAI7815935.1 hypothetical protein BC939DRAFT_508794 [Gamsiella multidivaricata]